MSDSLFLAGKIHLKAHSKSEKKNVGEALMRRVLHLISHLEEGGAQRQLSYAVSLAEKYEVEIASLIASPPEERFPFFRDVPVHFLSNTNDFYAPEILPRLRKLILERQYSLIHCWMFESIVQGVIASRLQELPCIAAVHTIRQGLHENRKKRWERHLIAGTLGKADLVLFPSHSSAIDFVDAGWVKPIRARTLWNAVDSDHFRPVRETEGTIVCVGRHVKSKGFSEVEEVVRRLQDQAPHLRCLIAGGKKENGHGLLTYTGFVEDVREVLGQATIFLSTSEIEGLSCALLEAQSMGIPCVVRAIGGNSEVIDHGDNGFLARDTKDFVQFCKTLLENPALRKEMGRKARDRVIVNFSVQKQIKTLEAIYGELL